MRKMLLTRINLLPGLRRGKYQKLSKRFKIILILKVALWRRFYTGFYDNNRKFIQMPLNEAADKVKISKKTLDDYLL